MSDVIIIGGGVAGLLLGGLLADANISHVVLEQAASLRVAGAGLLLQSNAMRVLSNLGLADELRAVGWEATTGAVVRSDGKVLQRLDLDWEPRAVALHRTRLMEVLLNRSPTVRTSAQVRDIEQHADHVVVHLTDGSSVHGACALGCDGLHSRTREILRGQESMRYAGYTAWRGICDDTSHDELREYMGPESRFGVVPIGGGSTYWFAVLNQPPDAPQQEPGDLLARFSSFPTEVTTLIERTAASAILCTPIHDRIPVASWVEGRVALAGDAAHPMTPDLGQGAGQAIEDAAVLAALIRREGPTPAALRGFESIRSDRANRIVRQSRQMGQMAQVKSPLLRAARNLAFRMTPAAVARQGMAWLMEPTIVD